MPQNVNKLHQNSLTLQDKIALIGINHVGTMQFFYFCVALVTIPLIFPSIMPVIQYISSGYLQLILLPLIMVGQNLQGRHAELRAEEDFKTNLKAEKEIEDLQNQIQELNKKLDNVLEKLK
ncbi:MAG: DUF1003 domain-containing protein [Candidatus Levyibacteriota bacterium]